MASKLKWRVDAPPTGRYRSFFKRGWPKALYKGTDHLAGGIECVDPDESYAPYKVKNNDHPPLKVYAYDYSQGVQNRRYVRYKPEVATLEEAKALLEKVIEQNPHFALKEA